MQDAACTLDYDDANGRAVLTFDQPPMGPITPIHGPIRRAVRRQPVPGRRGDCDGAGVMVGRDCRLVVVTGFTLPAGVGFN